MAVADPEIFQRRGGWASMYLFQEGGGCFEYPKMTKNKLALGRRVQPRNLSLGLPPHLNTT